jgi:hypothetical protein
MAVYKIFPEKSATLYSFYPTLNSGLDEILELSTYKSIIGTNEVSRPIIKFPTEEINDIMDKINGANHDVYLKLSLAYASELPLSYDIYCYPLYENWNVGTGRLSNSPITTDGVSWNYTTELSGSTWFTPNSFPPYTTGSYNTNPGGGLWITNSFSTQSFNQKTSKDIELKVTSIISDWNSGSIDNNGFIIKHDDSIEFTDISKFETKYFSGNTHTIYPPCLEFRWDDSIYNTGSLSVVTSSNIVITIGNNKGEYQQDSIQRFRINVRDQYPTRAFQSTSVYLNNKVLPTSSFWAIKDLDTEEIVVDFDTKYTKISSDNNGNYFDLYLSGMQPERYYKILIKSILSTGETIIMDNNYFFKIIR